MKNILFTITVAAALSCSAGAFAEDNVTVEEGVFGAEDEIGTKTVQPTVNRVYKIDNVAKKKAELEKLKAEKLQNANSSSENSEGLKKNDTKEENLNSDAQADTTADDEYSGGYRKRSLEEIQENLKLSPQELLDKVRKERAEAKEKAKKQPLLSSDAYNKKVIDAQEARREERRNLTKAERRALKEEQKMLYKARREERRNMTKAERRKIKEEMKAQEKARREQQKEDRKKRKKMRDMN